MKKLLLTVLCFCIFLSACSKPQNSNDDTDTLKNSDTSKISDLSPDTFTDTSFRPSDTDYPRATDTDDPSLSNEFTDDMISKLKQDFFKQYGLDKSPGVKSTIDDVVIRRYLGTYHNTFTAVYITVLTFGYVDISIQQDIAGYHFVHPSYETLYIYHDSTFNEIKDAYENGIITKDDVASIYNDYDLYLTERAPYLKNRKG